MHGPWCPQKHRRSPGSALSGAAGRWVPGRAGRRAPQWVTAPRSLPPALPPPSLQPPIPADARTAQSPATPPSRGQPAAAPEREPLGVRSQWAGRQVYTQQKARLRRWRCSAARHSSVGAQREGMRHRDPRTPSRRQARAWSNGLMFNGRMLGRRERGASALSRRMVRPPPPETGPLPDGASR